MNPGIGFGTLAELASRTWTAVRDGLAEALSGEDLLTREGLQGLVRLARPIAPFNQPELAAPLVGLAGALLSLVLAGVAVSSLGTLLVALLALAFLLTRVYGVSLEIGALRAEG